MRHPFSCLAPAHRGLILAVLFLAVAALAVVRTKQGKPLRSEIPRGIFAFEFVYGAQTAAAVGAFQATEGLVVDSEAGRQTAEELGVSLIP